MWLGFHDTYTNIISNLLSQIFTNISFLAKVFGILDKFALGKKATKWNNQLFKWPNLPNLSVKLATADNRIQCGESLTKK
jgi:hypothetical protein